MDSKSILITGTDTGVGKTTVACGIAAALRRRNIRVGVFKPAETGCPLDANGCPLPEDAMRLKFFSGCNVDLATVCPYALKQPLAPSVSAEADSVAIQLSTLADTHRGIAAAHDVTLIEGAGGLLVPLTPALTFADLAVCLDVPILIVVGSRLGCINHAMLTLRYARSIGLRVLGYVVNNFQATADLATLTNERVLVDWLGPALGTVPYLGEVPCTAAARDRLAEVFAASLNLGALLSNVEC